VNRNYLGGLLTVLALAGLGVWLLNNTHWEVVEERTSPQGDAVTNLFYSAQHLAESLGARSRVRHEIVTLPSAGAVMVVSFWNWALIPERRERLEQWVRDGGRLVVGADLLNYEAFDKWTGVKRLPWKQEEESSGNSAPRCPSNSHRLTGDSEHFDICSPLTPGGLSTTRKLSWRLRDRDGNTQALRVPIGRGSVTIVNAFAFGNTDLLNCDSALLFTAATQLQRGDEIHFLTDGRGASLLALLWSYGSPVIVLAALLVALWLWRSGVRFGPLAAAADPARRSLAEQIRGTGQFTLRFGGGTALYAATARALNEAAARHVPHYERLTGDERVAALGSLTGLGSGELAAALLDPAARRAHEIRKTIAFLEAARRRIAAPTR
jgi:hypothetical protein